MSPNRKSRRPGIRSTLALAAAFAIATLTGCTAVTASGTTEDTVVTAAAASDASIEAIRAANADQTVVNDDEWSQDDAAEVTLSGSSATTDAAGVTVADGTVTITQAGVYRLAGDFDGTIIVAAPDDALVVLILDGVTLTATDAPAIDVQTADDVAIFLADGSANAATSTGAYANADANAAIYSQQDLTISDTGSLTVDGQANDGITSKDDLVVLSGTIAMTAADDGLRGKDSLTVRGGTITVDAGGDGLTSDQDDDDTQGYVDIQDGTLDVTAGSDGIDGYTDVVITGGTVTIHSEEGIEGGIVAIGGGTTDLTTTDDGINGSAGKSDETTDAAGGMGGGVQDTGELVLIAGGTITIDAEGDGLDSNGSTTIIGGDIVVSGPTRQGNGGLDTNGTFTITGGALVAFDAGGMTETPSTDAAQAWLAASVSGSAGSTVQIVDGSGSVIAEYTAAKAFSAVVFSSAELVSGGSYTITVDGSTAATVTTGQAIAGGMGGGPGGQGGGPGGGGRP